MTVQLKKENKKMCEYYKNIKEEEPVAVKSDSTSLVST